MIHHPAPSVIGYIPTHTTTRFPPAPKVPRPLECHNTTFPYTHLAWTGPVIFISASDCFSDITIFDVASAGPGAACTTLLPKAFVTNVHDFAGGSLACHLAREGRMWGERCTGGGSWYIGASVMIMLKSLFEHASAVSESSRVVLIIGFPV